GTFLAMRSGDKPKPADTAAAKDSGELRPLAVPPEPKKSETPRQSDEYATERLATEKLRPYAPLDLRLVSSGRVIRDVKPSDPLPNEAFVVVAIGFFGEIPKEPSPWLSKQLVPEMMKLRYLLSVKDLSGKIGLSESDIATLATGPSVGTLHELSLAQLDLT